MKTVALSKSHKRENVMGAIALKVELAGKVFILGLTLPIVTEFLEECVNALSAV